MGTWTSVLLSLVGVVSASPVAAPSRDRGLERVPPPSCPIYSGAEGQPEVPQGTHPRLTVVCAWYTSRLGQPPPGWERALGRQPSLCLCKQNQRVGPGPGPPTPDPTQETEGSGPRRAWVTRDHPHQGQPEGATACRILAGGRQGELGSADGPGVLGSSAGFSKGNIWTLGAGEAVALEDTCNWSTTNTACYWSGKPALSLGRGPVCPEHSVAQDPGKLEPKDPPGWGWGGDS